MIPLFLIIWLIIFACLHRLRTERNEARQHLSNMLRISGRVGREAGDTQLWAAAKAHEMGWNKR